MNNIYKQSTDRCQKMARTAWQYYFIIIFPDLRTQDGGTSTSCQQLEEPPISQRITREYWQPFTPNEVVDYVEYCYTWLCIHSYLPTSNNIHTQWREQEAYAQDEPAILYWPSRHEFEISSLSLLTYVTQMPNVIVITAASGPRGVWLF